MTRVASLLRLIAGRRSKFVVLAVWVVLAIALGPLAGRFESVQQNEPSSFLPGGAESVRVLEASAGFPSGEATPAIAVFRDADGLDAAGRAAVEHVRQRVFGAGIEGVGELSPAVTSDDGKAAVLTIPIVAGGEEDVLIGAVEDVRELVREDLPRGLEAQVTGPAGFSADASKAFEGVNSTLLFATAGLVFALLVLIYRSPVFWFLPLLALLFAEAVVRGLGTCWPRQVSSSTVRREGSSSCSCSERVRTTPCSCTARYREELAVVEDKPRPCGSRSGRVDRRSWPRPGPSSAYFSASPSRR